MYGLLAGMENLKRFYIVERTLEHLCLADTHTEYVYVTYFQTFLWLIMVKCVTVVSLEFQTILVDNRL